MPDRCYWIRTPEGDEVLIPMCGAAAQNPLDCTCAVPGSRLDLAERGRAIAEAEVTRLHDRLERTRDRATEIQQRNRVLGAQSERRRKLLVTLGMPETESYHA